MKIIAFDLDDVLCVRDSYYEHLGVDKYFYCIPVKKYIDLMNQCYDSGYYIKIYTARGMTQFKGDKEKIIENLKELTEKQLNQWDAKYHELIFGKTHYDILIDDKSWNVKDIEDYQSLLDKLNGI